MSLFTELKRRNVFRVGIAYAIAAWLLLQVADLVLENTNAPDWVMQVFMLAVGLGFPLALILAWAFEMTPEGLKRESEVDRGESITPQTGKKLDRLIIGVMGAVIVFLLVDRFFLQPGAPVTEPAPEPTAGSMAEVTNEKSIAVLPFADLSQDQDQRWFADGLAEEILNALARTPDLLVSSRTSSFKYRDSELDIPMIATELGVAHVLEGSVRSGGGRIRVTAQLIRASDGFHVWSENYDRDPDDMISIQEDLARSIAQALETTMDPAALAEMSRVGTSSVPAYEQYLRGKETLQSLEVDAYKRAYEFFEEARRLDPGFARAHQAAAEYWLIQLSPSRTDFGSTELSIPQRLEKFSERTQQAMEHAASPIDRTFYAATEAETNLRYREANRLYQEYLAQRPNDLEALDKLNFMAEDLSQPGIARAAIETVRGLAMNDTAAALTFANHAHRIIGAEASVETTLVLAGHYSDNPAIQYQAHRTMLWAGRIDEARRTYQRFMQLQPEGDAILQARQACVDGDRARVEAILKDIDISRADGISERWHLLMLLDRKEEAVESLRPLESLGTPLLLASYLVYAQFDPRPYPSLMAVLEREGIERPPPVEIPFKCPPPEETSIAVLPFVNMSADADNEFFSDGVAEEILNVLARIPDLKVAARTSAFAFKGSNRKISEIASELGVNHVLEGSVRKAGDQVRVTAQLIQASDGFHLWSETFDRKLDNIFAIQDEIAAAIAGELKVSLGLDVGEAGNLTGTNNLEAYEHYLQGMSLWHLRTVASLEQSIQEFQYAIELDPGFAKAHAGLSLAWAVLPGYKTMDDEEAYRSCKLAAKRALDLDPDNVEAMLSLGIVARFELKWEESTQWFQRAIALNPSLATAHQWYGGLLEDKGELEASLASYQKAWALDPRSRIIGQNLAARLWMSGRKNEAMTLLEQVLEFAPEFPDALNLLFNLSIATDRCDQAEAIGHRLAQVLQKTSDSTSLYLDLCPSAGSANRSAAISTFLGWPSFDFAAPENPSLSYLYDMHTLLVELGEFDAAFSLLQKTESDIRVQEMLWLRALNTENGKKFKCDPRFIRMSDEFDIPPPVKPMACD